MTKSLELALKKLATLPLSQQENIAQLILKEIGKNIENEPVKDNDSPSLPQLPTCYNLSRLERNIWSL